MDRTQSLVIVLVVAAVAWAVITLVPGVVARAADRYARALDLRLDAATADDVLTRMRPRERAGAWAGALAASAVAGVALVTAAPTTPDPWPGREDASVLPLVVVGAYFLGHALGHAGVAWAQVRRPRPPEGPRVARLRTPTHADYVPPHERWSGWVAVGVAAVVALVLVVAYVLPVGELGAFPWALLAATLVLPGLAMAAYELTARRVLDRGQVAETPLALAWDDALRSRMLRDVLTAALFVTYALPVWLLLLVGGDLTGGWPGNPAVGLVNGMLLLLLGAGVVMALVSAGLRPRRHVRERLWPAGTAARPAESDLEAGPAAGTEAQR